MDAKIWQCFLEMMLEEKLLFNQIRVGEICKKATIHRSTFYRHFEDKYQLLEYGLGILWQDYFDLNDKDKLLNPFQTANQFFQESTAEKLIKRNETDDEFVKLVDHFFLKRMRETFVIGFEQEKLIELPHDLLSLFMTSTIQAIEDWSKEQNREIKPKELDEMYQKLALKVLKMG